MSDIPVVTDTIDNGKPEHAANTPALIQPDTIISNPVVRKIATAVIGSGSTLVALAVIIDQAIPAVDWSSFTDPATKILVGVAGLFMIGITTPNIATKN